MIIVKPTRNRIKIIILCVLVLTIYSVTHAEDYQYQYFADRDERHVPFSDYIPKVRLHYKTVPHYLEDYYELYGLKQYYNENTLRLNIERLKTALKCKFRHPSNALVKLHSEQEYLKYRRIMFMHINLLIMRNYLKIASRYDKQKLYFYNFDFAKEIRDSLDIAEKEYHKALPYWEKAKKYADEASRIRITTELGHMESERYAIISGELNYKKIINSHLSSLRLKKIRLDKHLSASKQ